jgi:FkbM family methyltransferase
VSVVTTRMPPPPTRAAVLARKMRWRAHWLSRPGRPFVVRNWWDGLDLVAPRSGSAATAYYRTFPSATIAEWLFSHLDRGMRMVDVGAHVGVYSLVAARIVGPRGIVHAIEPQHDCVDFIARNADANGLANIHAHCVALSNTDGEVGVVRNPRTMGAITAPVAGGASAVTAMTFDGFVVAEDLAQVDLVKLDAAGNELAVLEGAREALAERIQTLICKLYHPRVVSDRFGTAGGPAEIVDVLRSAGYEVVLAGYGQTSPAALDAAFADGTYSIPLLASRLRRT